jgi:GPH family glycoside/pentoside/hexuronide:cation symporter
VAKKIKAYQYSIWFYTLIAGICLAIPAWSIDEKRYCIAKPATTPIFSAIRQTFKNRHFKFFLVADFSYNTAMAIVYSSLLYYVTVLLLQPDSFGTTLMGLMIAGSLAFLGLLPFFVRRFGQKKLINFSFIMLGLALLGVFNLGRFPLDLRVQGYLVSAMTCIPLAIMSILPSALLADISDLDGKQTGEQKEGLFFAVRNLSQKLGQTIGMIVIAVLIQFGKDPGDDMGVRLTGLVGVVLCSIAALTFAFFREKRFLLEVAAMEKTYYPGEYSEAAEIADRL